jgi:uncharacterized protein with FMN-binding domain
MARRYKNLSGKTLMKKFKFIFIFFVLLFIFGCSTAYKNLMAKMPDLALKTDGVYRGNYDLSGTPVNVVLDVTVENHKITDIKIVKHSCSPIGKKAEKITSQIIEVQNLDVDAISGATGSSKAILKAVENALQ